MYLEIISQRLVSEGICASFNVNNGLPKVFERQLPQIPSDSETVVAVMPDMDPVTHDEELPGYYKTEVQVIVASKRIQPGNELANKIVKSLDFANLGNEDVLIKKCKPKHLPVQYRKNKSSAYEFSTNFKIVFVNRG